MVLHKNIGNKIGNFKVYDDIFLSDHNLITFNLFSTRISKYFGKMDLNKTKKWNLVTDITNMSKLMNNDLATMDVDHVIDISTDRIKNIYKKNLLGGSKKKKDPIWWDNSMEVERKRVRALRRRFQVEIDANKRIEY